MPVMVALLANAALLVPLLTAIGIVLALLPDWLTTLLWLPLAIATFVVIPAYAVIGSVHAAATAGRDLRRQMAAGEAFHRGTLAEIAARHGAPAPVRRYRLGESE